MQEGSQTNIEDKLKEAWNKQQLFIHTRGLVRTLIWLLSLVLTDLFVDWVILRGIGGASFGLLLLVINIGIILFVLWFEWGRYLKRYNSLITALDVESRHPELSSLLVSYTQLSGPASDQPNVSNELVQAMREQAIEKTDSINFREIVVWGQLRNIILVSAGVIAFFTVISIKWEEHIGTLLQRLVGIESSYPTKTTITEVRADNEKIDGPIKVRFGDSVRLTVKTKDDQVDEGKLFTRPKGEKGWPSNHLPLEPLPNDAQSYSRPITELTADTQFLVRVNDDKSEVFEIEVVSAPRIENTEIKQTFPDYISEDPESTNQLTLKTPEGTTLKWTLTCKTKVKALQVIVGENEKIDADISESGKVATFSRKADKAFNYSFHWTEGESGKDFEYGDVQQSVKVIADTLPEVQLLAPTSDGLATVNKTVDLKFKAADDHGLGQSWLVYQIDGSAAIKKQIKDFEGTGTGNHEYSWNLSEDIKEIKSGTQISYSVEVSDLFPGELAHVRSSATRKISIVEPDRYLQWYRSELATQQDEIKRARDSEETASTQVKQLREQEDEGK